MSTSPNFVCYPQDLSSDKPNGWLKCTLQKARAALSFAKPGPKSAVVKHERVLMHRWNCISMSSGGKTYLLHIIRTFTTQMIICQKKQTRESISISCVLYFQWCISSYITVSTSAAFCCTFFGTLVLQLSFLQPFKTISPQNNIPQVET